VPYVEKNSDFEVAGLFEIVIIGDKVRASLGPRAGGDRKREYGKGRIRQANELEETRSRNLLASAWQ